MTDFSDVESVRGKLRILCGLPNGRINPPDIEIANNWRPFTVTDPATLSLFSDAGAWEFIADCLEQGLAIKYKPPSAMHPDHAYELLSAGATGSRAIYMKIAIRPGLNKLIGVSFHYDRHT